MAKPILRSFHQGEESHHWFASGRFQVLAILIFAFAIRLAAIFYWHNQANNEGVLFRFGDSSSYWSLAEKIADGQSYEYGGPEAKIFRVPLYPLFLAPWTWISSPEQGVLLARFAGALLGCLSVALVMRMAFRMSPDRMSPAAGRNAAGILAAVYPGAIGMSIFILSEALFCPLLLLSLNALLERDSNELSNRKRDWWLSGMWSGLACLTRPSWILWPALLFFLVGIRQLVGTRQRGRASWFCAVWLVLGMSLIMSPWWIRNYFISHRFVPTTLQVGATLYDGWHDGANGGSEEGMQFVDQHAKALRQQETTEAFDRSTTFEYRLNRHLQMEAFRWAINNPLEVLKTGMQKAWRTWVPFPSAAQVANPLIRWSEGIAYLTILAFASLAIWRAGEHPFGWRLMWYPTAYYAILHLLFVGSIRYRQPPILVLTIVAGIGIGACWRRASAKRR